MLRVAKPIESGFPSPGQPANVRGRPDVHEKGVELHGGYCVIASAERGQKLPDWQGPKGQGFEYSWPGLADKEPF